MVPRDSATEAIAAQHYGFLVSESDFDNIYHSVVERGNWPLG